MIRNVYIIGSMSQSEEIETLASEISLTDTCFVRYVYPQPDKDRDYLDEQCRENIRWADMVIALQKPDGSYGQSVQNEMAYARQCGKYILEFPHARGESPCGCEGNEQRQEED